MSTHLTLDDGRVLGCSNGTFDVIVELVAMEVRSSSASVEGLADWLMEQRCFVQGPGIGYLDVRELSPDAVEAFWCAFRAIHWRVSKSSESVTPVVLREIERLENMRLSICAGDPPEAMTCEWYGMTPASGQKRGPGW